jgi:hypothetical protein
VVLHRDLALRIGIAWSEAGGAIELVGRGHEPGGIETDFLITLLPRREQQRLEQLPAQATAPCLGPEVHPLDLRNLGDDKPQRTAAQDGVTFDDQQ